MEGVCGNFGGLLFMENIWGFDFFGGRFGGFVSHCGNFGGLRVLVEGLGVGELCWCINVLGVCDFL